LLIIIVIICNNCRDKEEVFSNLDGHKIAILGHGGSKLHPSNTIESILSCIELGADGFEIDIQMTKDCVLVAFHDEYLSNKTNLTGIISAKKWSEIKGAYYANNPIQKYYLVSLNEILNSCKDYPNLTITLDCKLFNFISNKDFRSCFINSLKKISNSYEFENKFNIESQSIHFLNELKQEGQSFNLFFYPETFNEGYDIAINNNLDGVTISNDNISISQIQLAHDHNLKIAVWNVHSNNQQYSAISKKPDFIQTKRIKLLKEIIK
jgi:glycerophosphoryl diester phosphodiesterase